jgi:CheY-like chemotaxis protein
MLTVIQGHAGILLSRSDSSAEVKASAQAILFASERSAALTRQLLVFSRKSVLQPKPMDVADVVATMSKMVGRLLGETIHLELERHPDTPAVHADAGMLEQVIMNLGVNARDAMPQGGTVKISTYPVSINEEYVRTRAEAREGLFACLRVADTGCGMDAATKARIFEPFFTTKEVGKGTGLGLATVYGIVKQHDGWIEVESEPGKGTSFLILLPATQAQVEKQSAEAAAALQPRGGSETILVVEDEAVLREMATSILRDSGYQVLSAGCGPDALALWEEKHGAVDLLLTDMVMPQGISGIELATRLREAKPSLKVIFASGYSREDFESDFALKEDSTFIQKPYTHGSLVRAVRDSLDGTERGTNRETARDGN